MLCLHKHLPCILEPLLKDLHIKDTTSLYNRQLLNSIDNYQYNSPLKRTNNGAYFPKIGWSKSVHYIVLLLYIAAGSTVSNASKMPNRKTGIRKTMKLQLSGNYKTSTQ